MKKELVDVLKAFVKLVYVLGIQEGTPVSVKKTKKSDEDWWEDYMQRD